MILFKQQKQNITKLLLELIFIKITDKYAYGFDKYADTKSKAVPVLDYKFYKGTYWIKTVIIKEERKIIGWTTDYCPNPYDSCT